MSELWPTAHHMHVPIHAGWVDQGEIDLPIVQRKCLLPNDVHDLAQTEHRLIAFARRYEQTVKPFEWKFTCSDLALLMKRLAD